MWNFSLNAPLLTIFPFQKKNLSGLFLLLLERIKLLEAQLWEKKINFFGPPYLVHANFFLNFGLFASFWPSFNLGCLVHFGLLNSFGLLLFSGRLSVSLIWLLLVLSYLSGSDLFVNSGFTSCRVPPPQFWSFHAVFDLVVFSCDLYGLFCPFLFSLYHLLPF